MSIYLRKTNRLLAVLLSSGLLFGNALPAYSAETDQPVMFPRTQNVGGRVNLLLKGGELGSFPPNTPTPRVYVGGTEAEVVDFTSSNGSLWFIVPEVRSGTVTAQVEGESFWFGQLDITSSMNMRYISSVSPSLITPGETTITVKGGGFGSQFYPNALYIDDIPITSASWTNTEIRFIAPAQLSGIGTVKMRRYFADEDGGYILASGFSYSMKPVIDSVMALVDGADIYGGDKVMVSGRGFNFYSGKQKLLWGPHRIQPSSHTPTSISFTAPDVFDKHRLAIEYVGSNGLTQTIYSPQPIQIYGSISNDPWSKEQKYLYQINVPQAWKVTKGSKDVVVAIIDDGISINHPDLSASIWTNSGEIVGNDIDDDHNGYIDDTHGYNFVHETGYLMPNGTHGTLIAGIIGAGADNGLGMAGISQQVTLMPLIVFDEDASGNIDDAVEAIYYAVDNGANIINLSIGRPYTTKFDEAIRYAYSKNVTVIAAAGNRDKRLTFGINLDLMPQSPVCNDNAENMVLGVASVNGDDTPSDFTSYGTGCVDVVAPGKDILSYTEPVFTQYYSFHVEASGTSFAAPMATGVAALLKARYPDMTNAEIIDRIRSTADPLYFQDPFFATYNGKLGTGRINAGRALSLPYHPTDTSDNAGVGGPEQMTASSTAANGMSERLKGYILLQTESLGEAWYVNPDTGLRYYMKDGATAYQMMRYFSLGISDDDLSQIPSVNTPQEMLAFTAVCSVNGIANRVRGRILLQVEQNGEAWYVHPETCRRIYLKDGDVAYSIMRHLSLGITDSDINMIPSGKL